MQRSATMLSRSLMATRGFCTSSNDKIVASVLFERLPVVIPKIDPVVYAFQEFSFRWGQQYRRQYPDDFLKKSDARQFGFCASNNGKVTSKTNRLGGTLNFVFPAVIPMHGEKVITKSIMYQLLGSLKLTRIMIEGFEFNIGNRLYVNFTCDTTVFDYAVLSLGNIAWSLQRALGRRLYLLLHSNPFGAPDGKPVWHFPEKVYESEETLRKCAECALQSVIGDLSHTYFVGNAPMGHMVMQPTEKVQDLQPLKRFFFKSQVIATNKFKIEKCDDFVWVTKDELLEYFPEQADFLSKMIIS
ncbi:decoy [Actinidia rufa]|uniref:Large ribosomal subunit protein mL46 n=1 Tax=Actinidia rufa TaxID=165716 RepID=A0A7J0FFZ4_9ERIC|nr:decoy [Actinidia rufa]